MRSPIRLRDVNLIQGYLYKVAFNKTARRYLNVDGFSIIGYYDGWSAADDKFAFIEEATKAKSVIIIQGADVVSIETVERVAVDLTKLVGMPLTEVANNKQVNIYEKDPNGIDAHEPGAKLDAGKIYADAIFAEMARAVWGVAEVGTFGANKYSLGGWTEVKDGIRRYRDAAARHRLKRQMGESIDPDSGLKHTYHEAWNVLAALELEERACQITED